MQKIKDYLLKKQGSALVYSLIILGVMLFIVTSVSFVSITEKKNASSTDFSVQSYQTADSGFQLALKEINLNLDKKLNEVFLTCASGIVSDLPGAGPGDAKYTLSFTTASGPADCNTVARDVISIKSVGTYKGTVRAVEVAVAAPGAGLGAWEAKNKNTTYTAATDGFVVGTSENGNFNTMAGYTPVGTLRVHSETGSSGGDIPFTMPVRKGDTWRVDATGTMNTLFWISMGS